MGMCSVKCVVVNWPIARFCAIVNPAYMPWAAGQIQRVRQADRQSDGYGA